MRRHQNSIRSLRTEPYRNAQRCSITIYQNCSTFMYRLCKTSCLFQTCYKSNDTDNMNQQVRYKMKDTQFAITMASKSPTGNTTTMPRSTTASNSTASDRRLALQAILSEIDAVHLFNAIHMAKNEHKLYQRVGRLSM